MVRSRHWAAARLRAAGAVLLGKTDVSKWARRLTLSEITLSLSQYRVQLADPAPLANRKAIGQPRETIENPSMEAGARPQLADTAARQTDWRMGMRYQRVVGSGASLAYLDVGPVGVRVWVYLGGLGSAASVAFAEVVGHPTFAARGRHVLVDVVGSGWSDHDDTFGHTIEQHAASVVALLEDLKLREVTLVGHSMGGSIAISLASQRPDMVGRLVVAEPNLDPGVGSFSAQIAAVSEDAFAATEHQRIIDGLLNEGERGDTNAAQFARTVRRWSSRGLHRTAVSLLAERPASFREQLAMLDRPRHYIGGARSDEPLDVLRDAGCHVHVVPDAGHVMMSDNLDGFVAALDDTDEHRQI
jgi:pimeloyl-ACP methyl ester carboxylesterase